MDAALALACMQAVIATGIALLFIDAAIAKLRRADAFREAIAGYRLLAVPLIPPVAWALPAIELATGATLLLRLGAVPVLFGIALLVAYAGAVAINLWRGRTELDCGCHPGAAPEPIGWGLVGRNLALGVLLLACLLPAPALAPQFAALTLAAGGLLWLIGRTFSIVRRAAMPFRAAPSWKA